LFSSILLIFSWLTPNHYFPWTTAYNDFSIFLVLFFLGLYLILNNINLSVPKGFILLIALSVLPLFLWLLRGNIFFGEALVSSIYIAGFSFAFFIAFNLAKESEKVKLETYKIISYLIILACIVSVGIQLSQWLMIKTGSVFIIDLVPGGRPYANFAQPNNFATFLCLGLMASLYIYEKKYINGICGSFLAFFLLFGLVLTQSRTPWVFCVCFAIWWLWKTCDLKVRFSKKSLFFFISGYVFFLIVIPFLSEFLGVTTTADIFSRATNGYLRLPMWHQMMIAIQNEPWLGYGWNQVSVAQITVFLDYPTTEWIEHSHNILLDLIIWNGIPLGLLIILGFSYWLYQLSKLATSIEVIIALAMIGSVLVHAMLEYPLEYAFFLLPVGFLLGLMQADRLNIKLFKINKNAFSVFLLIYLMLYIWIFLEYRVIEKDVELARFELANIGEIHSEKAAPNVILLTQLREQIRFMRTEPKSRMTKEKLEWMKHVAYRYAMPISLYRYAQALALNGQEDEAKRHLLIIQKLYGRTYTYGSLFNKDATLAFKWNELSGSK
jgi:O-antigen ligase